MHILTIKCFLSDHTQLGNKYLTSNLNNNCVLLTYCLCVCYKEIINIYV